MNAKETTIDVTAMGELLIDFAYVSADDSGYPVMAAHPGGAPSNLLAALNAYGCSAALLGKVGGDEFGKLLVSTLAGAGIETRGICMDPSVFTTLAFVTIDKEGNRSFSFARKPGADMVLSFEELDLSLIDSCRDFHFGTLSLTAEPVRTATRKALSYARSLGKWISFDPNLRLPLWNSPAEAFDQIMWGLSQADIVKISDEEIDFLWPEITPEEAAFKIHSLGASVVFITMGKDGAFYSLGIDSKCRETFAEVCKAPNSNNSFIRCPDEIDENSLIVKTPVESGYVNIPQGITPVDTTGAGDIFGGAALSVLLKTGKDLDEITIEDLSGAAAWACTAASLSTQKPGGISSVPSMSEVLALMV